MTARPTSRNRHLLSLLSAGQVDAGFASLASFAVQVYAVNAMTPLELGAYALAFAAMVLGSQIPANLLHGPYEIVAIDMDPDLRAGVLKVSLLPGLAIAAVSGVVVVLGTLPARGTVPVEFLLPIAATGWIATVVSSTQDHIRRMAHTAHRSWVAAAMSGLHLGSVALGLFLLRPLGAAWVPFGALIIANLLSAALGLRLLAPGRLPSKRLRMRELRELGGWLLARGVFEALGGYLGLAVIALVTSTEVVGFVEGARVVARPVQVIGLGMLALISPRLMEAASAGRRADALVWRRIFYVVLGVAMIGYALIIQLPWSRDVLEQVLANGFVVPGLALASVFAHAIAIWSVPLQAELLGGRRQASLARITAFGSSVLVGGSFSAWTIGPFAGPVGQVLSGVTRFALLRRRAEEIYLPDGRIPAE